MINMLEKIEELAKQAYVEDTPISQILEDFVDLIVSECISERAEVLKIPFKDILN